MKSHHLRALRLATFLVVSLALCSGAFADRRTSLMGNTLIRDRDDSFIFPQEMLRYHNSLSVDYAASVEEGNALLIAGPNKNMAIGVALHRGDATSPLGNLINTPYAEALTVTGPQGMANALFGGNLVEPLPIADLMYAAKMGSDRFGARLGVLGGGNTSDDGTTDTESSLLGLRLSLGYSVGKDIDAVFDVSNESSSSATDGDTTRELSITTVHLGARAFFAKSKDGAFRLGAITDLNYMSASNTDMSAGNNPADEGSMFNYSVGFGPVYKSENKKLKVAFYANASIAKVTRDPNTEVDDDDFESQVIVFPGFNMAMEYKVTDWMFFRSGARSDITFGSVDTSSGSSESAQAEGTGFAWSAGLGFNMENLQINATLSNDFLLKGPFFVSGAPSRSLFSTLSAVANF